MPVDIQKPSEVAQQKETTPERAPVVDRAQLEEKKRREAAAKLSELKDNISDPAHRKVEADLSRSSQNSADNVPPKTQKDSENKGIFGQAMDWMKGMSTALKEAVHKLFASLGFDLPEGDEKLEWGDSTDDDVSPSLTENITDGVSKIYKDVREILRLPTSGERLAAIAQLAVSTGQCNNAKHCWDWVKRIGDLVGVRFGKTIFRTETYGKPIGVLSYKLLGAGDWLYVHNGNKSDSRGDHSVVFLGWINEATHTARVASFPGPGKAARVHELNFDKTPITSINKPVLA